MLRALASAFFYARFLTRFSRIGYSRRAAQWSDDPLDLSGQQWLVTGASGGIGAAIVRQAVQRGATVTALARDPVRLAALKASCSDPARCQTEILDLASVAAVGQWLQQQAESDRFDVLVNNVGVLLDRYQRSAEGLELSFATNLLNHFQLTEGLRSRGLLAADGCVVNVASGGMYGARLDLAQLQRPAAQHDGMAAYAQHKRAQAVLTEYWNAQWQGAPKVYVMHPGWVDTAGVQSALPWFRATLRRWLRSPEQGADTVLWLGATRPDPAAGIWLDRVCDPLHEFEFTRGGADGAALAAHLQGLLEGIVPPSTAPAASTRPHP